MSHVTIESKIVFDVCSNLRKKILAIREAKVETLINRKMSQPKGFFFKEKYTREEAICELETSRPFGSELFFAKHHADRQYERCWSLIQLSLLGNPVTITAEDVYLFADYIREKSK